MIKRKIGPLDVLEVPGDPEKGTILLLHGFGANAYDLSSLHTLCPGPRWIFPQGPFEIPFSSGYSGRAWFPIDIDYLTKAIRANRIEEVAEAFPAEFNQAGEWVEDLIYGLEIPRTKLLLGGFSQGAILATETVLNAPSKSGGLLIFSGILVHETAWKKRAHLHAHTPFFQSHGSEDALLPLLKAQELEQLLITGGLIGKLHTFQGGHEIPHLILQQCRTFLAQLFNKH